MHILEMLGSSASISSLPAIKLKQFVNSKKMSAIGGNDSKRFCKNGKTRRKYRRRRLQAQQRRLAFIATKRKLLAQRSIVLPKFVASTKSWARCLTFS